MTALVNEGLTAKPSKCFFGFDNLVFLGHHLTAGKIAPEEEKIKKLQETPRPMTKKQVKSFLGLTEYYRRFILKFAEVATPLTDATKAIQAGASTLGFSM